MPDQSFQDKTEPATPKRRQEARKKGEVAKSRELASIAVLSAGVVYLFFSAKGLTLNLGHVIEKTFRDIPSLKLSDNRMMEFVVQSISDFLWLVIPFVIIVLCCN